MNKTDLQAICICPRCASRIAFGRTDAACINPECGRVFPIVKGCPALVDFDNSVLDQNRVIASGAADHLSRPGTWRSRVYAVMFGGDESATNAANRLINLLAQKSRPRLLVIGGGTIGFGMEAIYSNPNIEIVAFDIYASPHVELIADAHRLPFSDGTFDAVWIQAVLEHVLEPERVVAEIHRILVSDGLVYAGTPFMQQVHEGAYDFTRFTEIGHRWLFRKFDCIDSGTQGGPGTVLMWSIKYFCAGLFRSHKIGRLFELSVFWLRFFDKMIPQPWTIDGASGVWFLGQRSDSSIGPKQIIGHYRGTL